MDFDVFSVSSHLQVRFQRRLYLMHGFTDFKLYNEIAGRELSRGSHQKSKETPSPRFSF